MSKRKKQSVNRMLKRGNAEARVNYLTKNVEIWARTKRSKEFTQLHSIIPAKEAIQDVLTEMEVDDVGRAGS